MRNLLPLIYCLHVSTRVVNLFGATCFSTSWISTVAKRADAGPAAMAAHQAAVVAAVTPRALVGQARIRAYDKWGCPGATRETRDALESLSCCSRDIRPVKNKTPLSEDEEDELQLQQQNEHNAIQLLPKRVACVSTPLRCLLVLAARAV